VAFENPSVAEFKAYFYRDFPYGEDMETDIIDADITKAFGQTNFNINEDLFSDQGSYTIGYLLLAAHYLVVDIRMSSQGINGKYSWLEQSKSVGSVSQSFAIPQRILDDPYMAALAQTNYGAKYLQLLLPQLAGQIFAVRGSTRP
jgi:hypothetical protein